MGLEARPRPGACIAGGARAAAASSSLVELRVPDPLIELRIFAHRGFAVDNVVLSLVCACFVPLFFFASVYAQVVLGYNAGKTGLYILVVFIGFASASQLGGRILDRRGARPAAVARLGASAAVGFVLWAEPPAAASLGAQWYWIILAGAGIGLALTPVSTDAVNRAPRGSYGEVTGVTQTVRYFASSLGLAVLGSVLISETRSDIVASLTRQGVPKAEATHIAAGFIGSERGLGGRTRLRPGQGSALRDDPARLRPVPEGRLPRDGRRDGGRLPRRRAAHGAWRARGGLKRRRRGSGGPRERDRGRMSAYAADPVDARP